MTTLKICLFIISTFLFGSIIIKQSHAIKCYVCQSNVDPKCADPFDNLTLPITDCDEYPRADLVQKSEMEVIEEKGFFATFGLTAPVKPLRATMCRKIRQKVNGDWRTIRGCGYLGPAPSSTPSSPNEANYCQIRHGNYDIFMETCTCNSKDGCNGSERLLLPDRPTIILKLSMCFLASLLILLALISPQVSLPK